MQSSNDHAVFALSDGKVETVTSSTCRDFVYFRQLLRLARRPDDNINHQLNKIDANNEAECSQLYEKMKLLHRERQNAIEFCKAQMKLEIDAEPDNNRKKILGKESGLLSSEAAVEEIVFDRTLEAIRNKCKHL